MRWRFENNPPSVQPRELPHKAQQGSFPGIPRLDRKRVKIVGGIRHRKPGKREMPIRSWLSQERKCEFIFLRRTGADQHVVHRPAKLREQIKQGKQAWLSQDEMAREQTFVSVRRD